jgi:hypothetical protein
VADRLAPTGAGPDNPEDVEITPEMIAAGVRALELWDSGDLPEWKAASVYKAMTKAARAVPTQDLAAQVEARKGH